MLSETVYRAGFQAALEGNHRCPHWMFSFDFLSWEAGNWAGHQFLCTVLEWEQSLPEIL